MPGRRRRGNFRKFTRTDSRRAAGRVPFRPDPDGPDARLQRAPRGLSEREEVGGAEGGGGELGGGAKGTGSGGDLTREQRARGVL